MREYFLLPDVAGGQAADSGAGAGGSATPSVATASEESAEDPVTRAYRILEAAKVYSSYREFQIARPVNAHDPRLPEIETDLRERLEPFLDFVGMRRLIMELDLYRLIGVVDRLRYQARWSRTPRIPQTSVLGHSLMVAVFSLLFSVQIGACPVRRYNNFFGALFHDLPEAVTRDIVAPTKSATPGLPDIVKQIEEDTVAEELYPFMSPGLREKIRYFTENEFESRVVLQGTETIVDPDEITARYNSDEFRPVDGKLIRVADEFAAFLEAHQSMLYGVSSPALIEGRSRIYGAYIERGTIAGVDVGAMYHQFELRS
ncbi:MAG: HD domain-containing protein [Spirochaetia bacterium]